jgi:hypothetical protein
MKPGFLQYLRAAFNARPFGMLVPPNWIGLAAIGLLGLTNPGFWVIGLGVELGYLALLTTNGRFQRTVAASGLLAARGDWQQRHDTLVARLPDVDQARYVALVARCRAILDQQAQTAALAGGLESQEESLGRLSWMYLQLLLARRAIARVVKDPVDPRSADSLDARVDALRKRLVDSALGEDLRKSLQGQLDIMVQRQSQRAEGKQKIAFLESELTRIQEQVELLREQAALSTDAAGLSSRIDEVTATLGGTAQWIQDQQKVFGSMDDLLAEPPLALPPRARQSQ